MTIDMSAGAEAAGQIFDQLSDKLVPSGMLGKPVTKKDAVRIPVYNVSVRGFMLLRPAKSGEPDASKPLFRKWVRAKTRVIGHVIAGPEGVAWKPRIRILKVVFGSVFLLISLASLAGKPPAEEPS